MAILDERYDKLMLERKLLKKLIKLDSAKYGHLSNRVKKIKTVINNVYGDN